MRRFKGGAEAEREERKVCREEVEAADLRNFQYMQSIRKEGWRQVREQRSCCRAGSGMPAC